MKKQILSYLSLGQICDVQSGGTPSRHINAYWEKGNIPWVKISDIKGKHLLGTDEYITRQGLENSSAKIFPKGTILYTIFATLGETTILNIDAATNQAIAGINIHDQYKKIILTDYLYYYLLSIKDIMCKVGRGVAQNNLNLKILRNVQVPVPTIEEQKKIIDTLSSIEKIMLVKDRQLSLLSNLVKSRFLERFGDPIINPFGYPIHKLGDYIENLTSGARGWARYYADDGNAWFITIKNVKNCKITVDNMQTINAPDNAEAKRTRVKEGDLLISITADLGRTGVVTKEIANKGSYINQHLSCIRLNRYALEPLYVAYFMESEAGKRQFKKENQSAVKAGINFKSIQSLKLMVPPLVRQEEFLSFYKQVDKSKYGGTIFLRLLEDIRICCNI